MSHPHHSTFFYFTFQISDFGMARNLEDVIATAGIGAAYFRAPEANECFYTTSCDVWSFGILIGQLCVVGNPSV
jgi:serine/threonine protein kinase